MIFITGATGLVGSHLLLDLLQQGEQVRALKRFNSNISQVLKTFGWYTPNAEALFKQIEWVDGDLLDVYSLEDMLSGVKTIYHSAAVVSFRASDRKAMLTNNVEGTSNLVNAALNKGVRKICHVSSVAALGKTKNGEHVTEDTNWIPGRQISSYSESKFFSEMEIWRGIEEGIESVVVNPSIIIGPGNWRTGSTAFFGAVNRGLKFYTGGTTGYVNVRDVTKAMVLLMSATHFETIKNQRFILSAENISYRDFLGRVASALNKPEPRLYASPAMLALAWRAAGTMAVLTGKAPLVTRETAQSANTVTQFDGSKISKLTGFEYSSVTDAIEMAAQRFLEDHP